MGLRRHTFAVLILCAGALAWACGESSNDGVPAVNLSTGKTNLFDPGQLPEGWAACLDRACTRIASQIPCQNLGPALCGQRPECRQRLLWCDGIEPTSCGDDCADKTVVECTYACMPMDSLMCDEIAARPACADRPDCRWQEAYCPDNCPPDTGGQSCAGCRAAGCFASEPPPCEALDPSSCSYRTDCEWTPKACPGCQDPNECACEPYCRPVENCPSVTLPPSDFCDQGQIIPQYDSGGCLREFTCVKGCPSLPEPPRCEAGPDADKIRDLGDCIVGYSCPLSTGIDIPFGQAERALSCADLAKGYKDLLWKAKTCSPGVQGECTKTLPSAIACGCPTAVNAGSRELIEQLDDILRKWSEAACDGEIRCAARACVGIEDSRCEPNNDTLVPGTCQD